MPETQAKRRGYRKDHDPTESTFTKVPNRLLLHKHNGGLTTSELAVLVSLLYFFFDEKRVRLTIAEIAEVVGLKERRVRSVLKKLCDNEVVRLSVSGENGTVLTFAYPDEPRQYNAEVPRQKSTGVRVTGRHDNAGDPGTEVPPRSSKTSKKSYKKDALQDITGASIAAPTGEDKECAIPFSDPGTQVPGSLATYCPDPDDPNYCPF